MENGTFANKDKKYYSHFKWWMLPLINDGPNVIMDVGCASGRLGKHLLEVGKAKDMYGAELFPEAAADAAKCYKEVLVGNIEEMNFDFNECFDYVICADILEHLKDPYTTTRNMLKWLKRGGCLFVCVPNVRNYRLLADLIFRGKWEYVSAGILDRTHMRFFTRSSLRNMLEEAGFDVYHENMVIEGPKKSLFNRATFGLFDEFLASQSFCCGRKGK